MKYWYWLITDHLTQITLSDWLISPYSYINWEYVCDEANDCLDGSDECQDCNFDILANDRSLIANDALAWLVWIMGTVALLGNLVRDAPESLDGC